MGKRAREKRDAPERVAVGGDEDLLALENEGADLLVEVGQGALGGELEGLSAGGRDIVAAPPDVDLLLAPLFAGIVLVEPGELAVVALVERLVLVDRDVLLVDLVEDDVERGLGAREGRGEGDVKLVAALGELFAALLGLFAALFGQFGVLPAGEQVELCDFGMVGSAC